MHDPGYTHEYERKTFNRTKHIVGSGCSGKGTRTDVRVVCVLITHDRSAIIA